MKKLVALLMIVLLAESCLPPRRLPRHPRPHRHRHHASLMSPYRLQDDLEKGTLSHTAFLMDQYC